MRATIFLYLISVFAGFSQDCKNVKLVFNNNLAIESNSGDTFSGDYIEYYPGRKKMTGHFLHGKKHGEFEYYYDDQSNFKLKRIESWKNGERHGVFKWFDFDGVLYREAYFTNNKIDSIYRTWNMLTYTLDTLITFDKGQQISSKVYDYDSIYFVMPILNIEESLGSIDKLKALNQDSLILNFFGSKLVESSENIIWSEFSNYKVISFSIWATIYTDLNTAGHIDYWFITKRNYFPKKQIDIVFSGYAKHIWIDDIIVENEDGLRWEYPQRKISILNYDK